jgi:hypothetical protein
MDNEVDDTMTGMLAEYDEMMACRDHVAAALGAAIDAPKGGDHDGWVAAIVFAVTIAANEWAIGHGHPTVTVDEVALMDEMAMGHVDYHAKFSLRVAQRVVYGEGVR